MAATTEDHIPSRTLFHARAWPEGFVFPACEKCNAASADDEEMVAWLSLLRVRDRTPDYDERIKNLFESIGRRYPGLLESMNAGASAERYPMLATMGFLLPQGMRLPREPVLSLRDPRIHDAVMSFARKLGLALYYRHFKRAMPEAGFVATRWYSNKQIDDDEIPREIAEVTPHAPQLTRSNVDLSGQIFIRLGTGTDAGRDYCVFMSFFHESFAIVGFMSSDRHFLGANQEPLGTAWRVHSPYDWPQPQ